jgi:hypothetical protein
MHRNLLLARESRAGNLTPIAVPDERDEAIRDLSRAREDAIAARLRARQQLKALMLRHGRTQGQPKAIRDIAWKAQLRLTQRYRKLSLGRKMKATKVCVAVARELCGFIWDLARHVPAHQ